MLGGVLLSKDTIADVDEGRGEAPP
nr:hypothetical protein [Mycobacterium haemophilum]